VLCVLFDVLSATLWCLYCSVCLLRLYGVCTLRYVECDCMVCVLFGVFSATLWCVYSSACVVRLYGLCTVRCVERDSFKGLVVVFVTC